MNMNSTILIYNNSNNSNQMEYKWLLVKDGEELGYCEDIFQEPKFRYSFIYHHKENDINICEYE